MRYGVHYLRWDDAPEEIRLRRPDVAQILRHNSGILSVGVCFRLTEGRLSASHLSVSKNGSTVRWLPCSDMEAQLLVPLAVREALWQELTDWQARYGVPSEP